MDEIKKKKEIRLQHEQGKEQLKALERRVKTDLLTKKVKLQTEEDVKAKTQKVIDKEERFKTAKDKVLKGKERMQPTRPREAKKESKKQKVTVNDSMNDAYYEAP